MNFYLIRHCPVKCVGVCYGQSEVPVHAWDEGDCGRLIAQLPTSDALLKFSSPLIRCRMLSEQILGRAILDDRLMELNFGAWEGVAWDEINRDALDDWAAKPLTFSPGQGESFKALIGRVARWKRSAEALARRQGIDSIAVVTHAGVIKAMAVLCSGVSVREVLSLRVAFAEVIHFRE